MKKLVISTVAAAALIAAPFTTGKADAAGFQPVNTKVVYYQANLSDYQDLNKLLSQYNIDLNQFFNYQPAPPSKQQPVKKPAPAQPAQKPVQQKPAQKPAQQSKPAAQANSQLNAFEQQVVDLTNQERAKYGLSPLKVDIELSKVAREKSRDMSVNHYFDHTSPTYGSPFDMMKKFGITYRSAGENIAMGQQTPQEVVRAWMNSEGHRANILNSSYTHIGVGYVANGNYWTQQFIGK
ncbi:sporulation protein [Bacillus sp. FJAT-49732]|uniref:Sporulation protein n=1 Tax=Lederbergia citrisecunda TaxID=2833583 RepID=A0A942TMH5_9BACI|nr:CAP domain-containing protein [Lederbergia citrisecunda]MBS4199422.1 sporulation protein [Lederbergia citrisecunda]